MSEWIHSYIVVVFHLLQSCNLFLLCCYSSLSVLGPKELPCLNTNSYLECRSIASEVKSRQNDSEKSIKWEVDLKQMVADFQKEAKKELSDELDTSRVTKKTEPETGKKHRGRSRSSTSASKTRKRKREKSGPPKDAKQHKKEHGFPKDGLCLFGYDSVYSF